MRCEGYCGSPRAQCRSSIRKSDATEQKLELGS